MEDAEYLRAEARRCLVAAKMVNDRAAALKLARYAEEFARLAAAVERDEQRWRERFADGSR